MVLLCKQSFVLKERTANFLQYFTQEVYIYFLKTYNIMKKSAEKKGRPDLWEGNCSCNEVFELHFLCNDFSGEQSVTRLGLWS